MFDVLRWFTILVAVIGVAVGIFAVVASNEKPPVPPLARQCSVNSSDHAVPALVVLIVSAGLSVMNAPTAFRD